MSFKCDLNVLLCNQMASNRCIFTFGIFFLNSRWKFISLHSGWCDFLYFYFYKLRKTSCMKNAEFREKQHALVYIRLFYHYFKALFDDVLFSHFLCFFLLYFLFLSSFVLFSALIVPLQMHTFIRKHKLQNVRREDKCVKIKILKKKLNATESI